MDGSDPRPSVLRIITRLNIGGPARQAGFLTRALPEFGFRTALVTGVEEPSEGRIDPGVPATVISELCRSISPARDAVALRKLRRLLRRERPDIVHTHLAKAGMLGRLAATGREAPIRVHTFHGHVLEGYFGGATSRTLVAAERALAHRTDVLIAVSESVRDELFDLGIGRADQWRVIPLGLELDRLLAEPPERALARGTLGLPETGPVIGIVGRLVPIKDHLTFLRMAVEIATERPDVWFAVIGDGERRSEIAAAVPSELAGRVVFTGWREDLPSVYAALDLVVLTSRNEGTPVALIEAGAAGRPVVATDVGGVRSVVEPGVTGSLVPAGDVAALAREALRPIEDPSLARRWGEAARERVTSRFTSDRLARDIAELYRELLAR